MVAPQNSYIMLD